MQAFQETFSTYVPQTHVADASINGMSRPTILIAEDAADTRVILSRTLEFENYSYITAADGEEAFQKILKYQPNLILLDLMLPKLNGFQLMMRLKNEKIRSKICVISSADKEDFVQRSIDFGASDYLIKPVFPDAIAYKIKQILGERGAHEYFKLPCMLSCNILEPTGPIPCRVKMLSEVGLTLQTKKNAKIGEILSIKCPTLNRILERSAPLFVRVNDLHRNGRHEERFDFDVDFVGITEVQRQKIRAEVIQGRFLLDEAFEN